MKRQTADLNANRAAIESMLDRIIALGEEAHALRTQITGEVNRRPFVRLCEENGVIGLDVLTPDAWEEQP